MLDPTSKFQPTVEYRPIRLSDLQVLEQIHVDLFPVRYERDFFLDVVNGNGIISWGAVDTSRSDELVGFVTTKMVSAQDSEIEDIFSYNCLRKDSTLVYILTLGVVDRYRNLGIASSLVQEVIKYGTSIINCRGVYLHVISYNQPAIRFYKKMLFNLVRRLPMFYYIKGQHYDSLLFVYYVREGLSPCSLLGFLEVLVTKIWSKKNKSTHEWSRFKESSTLLVTQTDMRIISSEDKRCHV
ncbi:histone acetyltransferase MCC1-like [Lolium rigidum]|uniref:histone acetyltransferase MCC1-like n=1 Tax=Lolium rigidum TaxID=89674 RepID=UPI001F5C4588|nr:histone acetyltransferase MCC1-like [Lolium rigidum]